MSLSDRSVRSSPFSREAAQAEPVTNEAVEELRTPGLMHLAEVLYARGEMYGPRF
jgi:hypothetical protein